MTRRPVRNMAASVHQRLLNHARERGRPFNELLQYFAMERFLYRLAQSPHRDRFVLKGGLMLLVWEAPLSRPTRDIDLLGRMPNDPSIVASTIAEVCVQGVTDDGLTFDPATVQAAPITEHAEYQGVRVKFRGQLGNAQVPMQIDVGFGDVVTPRETEVTYPTLLDFPAPEMRAYPRETLVAEKLEAMVRLGELNSRMQDFYDLWLLSRQFQFDGGVVADAVRRTFANRETEVPSELSSVSHRFGAEPAKQTQWAAYVRRNLLDAAPGAFAEVVGQVAEFTGPLLKALASEHDFGAVWSPGGPWCE